MNAKAPKGAQGKRYTAEQKTEIIAFVNDFNAKNKRGGLKAAGDKYGVSVVTLSAWMKNAGKPAVKKAAKKAKKPGRKPGRKPVRKPGRPAKQAAPAVKAEPAAPANSVQSILDRMSKINKEISALQKEFNSLKKQL